MNEVVRKICCAVYTRKSNEEGLEQEFNSLQAQREACENYIMAQKSQGWTLAPGLYDDGGFTGGNIERPALQRLLADIKAGRIDMVLVYKIDRLSRSLLDFLNMLKLFEENNATFVSVTQNFDTSSSMGKLMLNVLLSFAQFEREITGERIRDKIAASKKKGMWMGGTPPFGYDIANRGLAINETEAVIVKRIFQRFVILGSATEVVKELRKEGVETKTYTSAAGKLKAGKLIGKGFIYKMIANPVYVGEVSHKGQTYSGQHQAIIDRETWDKAKAIIAIHPHIRSNSQRQKTSAMLKGVIRCGGCNCAMTPYHARKKDKLYRYYKPDKIMKGACESCPIRSVPAGEIENVVLAQLKYIFCSPEIVVGIWKKAKAYEPNIKEPDVLAALSNIGNVWNELFPAEQAKIIKLMVKNVIVGKEEVSLQIKTHGISSLINRARAITNREG